MSVQSYLESRASGAVLSATEKSSIETSVSTLSRRLSTYFASDIRSKFKFGSFTRGTILPRSIDLRSDVDYMIVFGDEDSKPQTYISRLKRFAEKYYSSSEISQSSPTVVLSLNHIRFDLVPAIKSYTQEYRIPAPASSYEDWTATSPNDFNLTLTSANTTANYKLKPAIRLLKFWNAKSGYVYDSYLLEKWVAGNYSHSCTTVRDYFFRCVDDLSLGYSAAQWRKNKLQRAKDIVNKTKEYERDEMPYSAESEVKKLIPEA
jgi:hypothetical protein